MTNWPLMTEAELHALGIELIVPGLAEEHFVVESVDKNPARPVQVIGTRWGLPAVIAIRTACHPATGGLSEDDFFRLLEFVNEKGGLPCFAGVGLECVGYPDGTEVLDKADRDRPIRGGRFQVEYKGLMIAGVVIDK